MHNNHSFVYTKLRTYFKKLCCPKCGKPTIKYASDTCLPTYPPQYQLMCTSCDNRFTSVHKPVEVVYAEEDEGTNEYPVSNASENADSETKEL